LLTGTTPFDKDRLKEVGYDELRRIIREEEPPRPSTRLSTLGKAATTLSTPRQGDPKRLSQLCRGELDWIVMKALEKDRNRRYESASALAADVQHYLRDEAVQAFPPSAWYRFYKFARRKKTALVVAACVVLALAGIAGGIGWAVRDRAAREEGIERERRTREDALDEAVERTLNETAPLIEQEKWPEALAAVAQADKLLGAAGRTARPPRLLELRKELSMAERLEGIYRQPAPGRKAPGLRSGEGGTGATVPGRPGSSEEDFFSGRQADAEFARAFGDFGIDVDALAPAEAAARITRLRIRPALVKALGEWASMRRRARGANDPGWKRLIDIARRADPDPWRNRCREGLLRRDRRALEQLADAVPIRQVHPTTLWLLGGTLQEVGALEKALSLLRRAQHEYPGDFWINDTLAWFCWTKCRPPRLEDALRFYSIALVLRPQRPLLHDMVARILIAKGAFEEAALESSTAIGLDPKLAVAWYNRGQAHRGLRRYDRAVADYSRAIELEPKWAVCWYWRGCAHRALRRYDRAVADHSRAIELEPKYVSAWINRGYAHAQLRQYDRAIADYSRAIELDPKRPVIWNNRGWVYRALRQYDREVPDRSRVIELDPKNPVAWNNRGEVFASLGQWDKAIADFSRSIELNSRAPWPWHARALVRLQRGDGHGYRRDCAGMLRHFGTSASPEAAHWTVWTCIQVPDGADDWAKLGHWAEKTLAADPKDFFRLTTLGAVLYRAGRFEEAARRLTAAEAAARRAKPRPSILASTWLLLAMVEARLGHAAQARAWLARAVREIEQPPAESAKNPFADTWNRRLTLRLLRAEAEALLKINKRAQKQEPKHKM
jgi:tetratricopeptide (TPR) repeat protein